MENNDEQAKQQQQQQQASKQLSIDSDHAFAIALQEQESTFTMLETIRSDTDDETEDEEEETGSSSSHDFDGNFDTQEFYDELEFIEEDEEGSFTDEIEEDEIDPDEMSYEELIALGEVVGEESRGLSIEEITSSLSSCVHKFVECKTTIDSMAYAIFPHCSCQAVLYKSCQIKLELTSQTQKCFSSESKSFTCLIRG
ncbi:E3 ubiquitin ligase BIG BROTHER-related isoform X2 [Spinacia oleracea]|uniref:E3 ubiquitin ligase BIG BROTHER-related isoform X2 n=1 Tax=Spinacia oleracea TaxID=3562 RepID=A0ABM3QIW7_SPIOL|nr:E3 ubiquitin ligase BIG BROTHER-related-like isoform X2 [Spinacia oleracea]